MRLEKRKDNRVLLSVPVHYKVFKLDHLEVDIRDTLLGHKAELQNVSLGGLQVVANKMFQPGAILELELEIPGGGHVRSVAKVVWCKPEGGASKKHLSGIRFIPVYEEDLKKLVEFLKPGG